MTDPTARLIEALSRTLADADYAGPVEALAALGALSAEIEALMYAAEDPNVQAAMLARVVGSWGDA